MVSHPGRGGRCRRGPSRWLSAPLALYRRVARARERHADWRSTIPPGERWRHAKRSGALDGALIAAVFVMGVAVALVMSLL